MKELIDAYKKEAEILDNEFLRLFNKKMKLIGEFKTNACRLFDNENDAIVHESILNGDIKICPRCHGTKSVDMFGDDRVYVPCSYCNGIGYK